MRGLTQPLLDAFNSDHVVSIILIELEFDSGIQRYNTSPTAITYNGDIYIGVGEFGKIEPILEDQGIKMKGIQVALQGVDTTVIDLTVNEAIQGRPARLHLATYDYDTATISDAFEIFSGSMDTIQMARGKDATMILSIESIMTKFDLANVRRFTTEDHKTRYPTDKFFDLMPQMNEATIVWGPMAGKNVTTPYDDVGLVVGTDRNLN